MIILKRILLLAFLAVLFYYGWKADFYVWQLQHPQAPEWTYFWGR